MTFTSTTGTATTISTATALRAVVIVLAATVAGGKVIASRR